MIIFCLIKLYKIIYIYYGMKNIHILVICGNKKILFLIKRSIYIYIYSLVNFKKIKKEETNSIYNDYINNIKK